MLFLTLFARDANSNVDNDSYNASSVGLIWTIKRVLLLPPREHFKSLVSLESLYGIWIYFVVKLFTTLPSANSDLLIFLASERRNPWASVRDIFSEPARSARNSFDN